METNEKSWTGIWSISISILLLTTLCYVFNVCAEHHYDVKKGTFLWIIAMGNKTVKNFPIIQNVDDAKYNSLGGDSPNIGAGWELEYTSDKAFDELFLEIKNYLKNQNFEIRPVEKPECSWRNYQSNDKIRLFAAVSDKGECLDLTFKRNNEDTKIELLLLY